MADDPNRRTAPRSRGKRKSNASAGNKIKSSARFFEAWDKRAAQERSAWLSRPQLDIEIFEYAWRDHEWEKSLAAKPRDVPQEYIESKEERRLLIKEMTAEFGWSEERLKSFTEQVAAYSRLPVLANYLRVRREFPEVEIRVGQFGGIDALFKFAKEFEKKGVHPQLVAGALDADEPSVDALCLRLIELLIERDNIPRGVPGYKEKIQAAISETIVNYLISMVLGAYERNGEESRVPASLVVLLRHQLCGEKPDLVTELRLREHQGDLALTIARRLREGERLSVNKLSKWAGIPRSTAARWLKDPNFQRDLKLQRLIFLKGGLALKSGLEM